MQILEHETALMEQQLQCLCGVLIFSGVGFTPNIALDIKV
jgi:hypothetical protein